MVILKYIFMFNVLTVGSIGLLINYFEPYLPNFISRSYRYGKFATDRASKAAAFEVPKRWFRHFYVFGAINVSIVLILLACKYYFLWDYPEIIYSFVDTLCGDVRQSLVPPERALLALILIAIHIWKRLYETTYVSVFSDKNINLVHYIVGHVHYFGTIISVFADCHGGTFRWSRLTYIDITCVGAFLFVDYLQLGANQILGKLRKNEKNVVVYQGYKIPNGQLFDYISSPLQLTEILLYLILLIIVWQSQVFHYIAGWVTINQLECAVLTHQWNRETFKNYPKNRKILIPYVF